MQALKELFKKQGLLARHVAGYAPRPQQLNMAQLVWQALNEGRTLLLEAGTGTGKTYAYLAPAILSGQKVFISTGTKNLQDQLFHKDLPVLRKVLAPSFRASLLKGRANYLCRYRLSMAIGDPKQYAQQAKLQRLQQWAHKTKSGDLSASNILKDDDSLLPKVTSTAENCLNQKCDHYDDCFVVEARKKAQEADIVVINHHLLMSDMAIKASGQGEVLPSANAYIIDEAHKLPEIARQFLGKRTSSHQIKELCTDISHEIENAAKDMAMDMAKISQQVLMALDSFYVSINSKKQRLSWHHLYHKKTVMSEFNKLIDCLKGLSAQLKLAAERSSGLDHCYQRCERLLDTLNLFISGQGDDKLILWADIRPNGLMLYATPLDISGYMQDWMNEAQAAWILTSATLTVSHQFDAFSQQLGIRDAKTKIWQSPFDFATQSLLYMPAIAIKPKHKDYNNRMADIAKEVIAYSKGRTFILFTSYQAMHEVAAILKPAITYPLFVQGRAAKSILVDRFRKHGHAVLLGTTSFWEGVDVRGEALSCVIIDKIPFESPADPVLGARIDLMKKAGGNPFLSIQVPAAIIRLKQGVGRLIRDPRDYGVLVICDPRITTQPYGKLFLESLPPMPVTHKADDVATFFADHAN